MVAVLSGHGGPQQNLNERQLKVYPQLESRAVAWWPVLTFTADRIGVQPDAMPALRVPLLGTPGWCALDDTDPAKLAAVLDGGQHFALRLEIEQEARADASHTVSAAADWRGIAQAALQRDAWRAQRPWSRRVAS